MVYELRELEAPAKVTAIFCKDDNFWFSVCIPAQQSPSKKGTTLKGKNLLPKSFLLE